ncbi:MAG: carbohydrate ABC transporter permease [Clostridiales bacterium]|nr:carbohydrate ABC transporter permease [Bacillota bacterium]NLL54717.1 carbohydrate ABC transporter permease [Clostridiales bacterium]
MTNKKKSGQIVLCLIFVAVILVNMFPVVWMVSSSLKTNDELFSEKLHIIPPVITLESYRVVMEEYSLFTWYKNSFLSTAGIFILQVLVALMAAFGITYYKTRWNSFAFYFIIVTMVIPFQVTMIPNYVTISNLGLKDKLGSVILPYVANATTFFYLYQNLKGIPREYYEVSRIEGGNAVWTFSRITMGLCKGAISAISILTVIDSWNLYFWPMLVLTKPESRTMTIALRQFLDFEMGNRWGPFMATATLASLPVIVAYLFFQRNIINAFISAGVKG